MPGLYTGATGLWGGFPGLLFGSASLSTPPGLLADAAGFSPASLFAAGEQGVWYDPSDFSTMFQDSAGTTPVTAVEQPLGRILDKSGNNNHATQATSASRPVLSARVNQLLATDTLSTQSVTTLAAIYTLAFSGAGSITLSGTATGTYTAGSNSITCTAGTLTLTVSGAVINADLRVTNDTALPAYQRVTTSTNYDTTGFPLYLRFDGVDDGLASNSMVAGTNKTQLLVAERKLVDGIVQVFAEYGDLYGDGTSHLVSLSGTQYQAYAQGATSLQTASYPVSAPTTNVITNLCDMGSPFLRLRVDGTQVAQNTDVLGTGNFGTWPIRLGYSNFGGNTYYLNGRIYGVIMRFGPDLSVQQLYQAENYLGQESGVSIPPPVA